MTRDKINEDERYQINQFFKKRATMQIYENGYFFDDKAENIRIHVMKKEIHEHLKKDQLMVSIGTQRGLITLYVNHRQLVDLKRELFRYEAVFLNRGPEWFGKKITPKDMEWEFK